MPCTSSAKAINLFLKMISHSNMLVMKKHSSGFVA